LHFKIKTPIACPWYAAKMNGSSSHSWSFLFYFFSLTAIFLVYNIIGVYYNQKKHGLVGSNAIPHIDKWRRYIPLAKEYSLDAANKVII